MGNSQIELYYILGGLNVNRENYAQAYLLHRAHAAQADLLVGARFEIAVAALAYHNRRDAFFLHPVAIFLKGLGGALRLHIFVLQIFF